MLDSYFCAPKSLITVSFWNLARGVLLLRGDLGGGRLAETSLRDPFQQLMAYDNRQHRVRLGWPEDR
jgi:hypothetical protein